MNQTRTTSQVMSLALRSAVRRRLVLLPVLFLLLLTIEARFAMAQEPTTRSELWPEVDVYITIKPKVRLFLIATMGKAIEDGEIFNAQAYEAQVGIHVDYIPNKHVILRNGYRYGTAVGDNADPFKEHRILTEQTFRKLLPHKLLFSDRNRQDWRFINGGNFSFRYRNRVQIEREFRVFKGRTMTPYATGEISYDTRYDEWNRKRYAAGIQTSLRVGPLGELLLPHHQVILDLFYMRQNDNRADPPHVNVLGVALSFYF